MVGTSQGTSGKGAEADSLPPEILRTLLNDSYHQRHYGWQEVQRLLEKSPCPAEQLKALRLYLEQHSMDFDALYQLRKLEERFMTQEPSSVPPSSPSSSPSAPNAPQTGEQRTAERKTTEQETTQPASREPAPAFDEAAAKALLNQLVSDEYIARLRAEEVIQQQAHQGLAAPWLRLLRRHLMEQTLMLDDTMRLLRLEDSLRKVWLFSLESGKSYELDYKPEEIEEWKKRLAESQLNPILLESLSGLDQKIKQPWMVEPGESPWGKIEFLSSQAEHQNTQIELRQCWLALRSIEDMLAAEFRPSEMNSWLVSERSKTHSAAGEIFLKHLEILFRPCVASEYWTDHHHLSSQIVIIDVPQKDPNNTDDHATAFSQLTKTTVRCVDGYNLNRGVHPLERAIRHPKHPEAFFYINSLASPRQKLLYPFQTTERQKREKAVVENTLKPCMEKKELTEDQYFLLERMEPSQTSIFVARMLNEFPNATHLLGSQVNQVQNQKLLPNSGSLYELLCQYLIKCGTKEAIPGFLQAVRDGKMKGFKEPYDLENMVLLSIASRDPWDGAEDWLKERLQSTQYLVKIPQEEESDSPMQMSKPKSNPNAQGQIGVKIKIQQENSPQLGACAAAAFGRIHGYIPEQLDLIPERVGMPCCPFQGWRFPNEETRKNIRESLGL